MTRAVPPALAGREQRAFTVGRWSGDFYRLRHGSVGSSSLRLMQATRTKDKMLEISQSDHALWTPFPTTCCRCNHSAATTVPTTPLEAPTR